MKKLILYFFFGGEPSLCPDTISVICDYFNELVYQKSLHSLPVFTMVTNSIELSDKLIQTISEYKIRLTVSLDGEKEVHDQLRVFKNGKGSFDLVLDNLARLRQAGIQPVMIEGTYTSLHQQLGLSREDVRNQIRDITKVQSVYLADCTGESQYAIKEQLEEDLAFSKRSIINLTRQAEIATDVKENKDHLPYKCTAGYLNLTLMPDGKLFPCHQFLPDQDFCLGVFRNNNWDFSSYPLVKKRLEQLDKLHQESCKGCWAKWLCRGCPAADYKNLCQSYKSECNTQKKVIEYCLIHNNYFEKNIKE